MRKIILAIAALVICAAISPAYAQYWKVGSDTSNVWSLSDTNFVPSNDTTYLGWIADGNRVRPIATTAELYDVIEQAYPAQLAAAAPVLDSYGGLTPMQAFMWRKESGLYIVYTGDATLNGLYQVDDQWLGGLMTAALLRCGTTALDACAAALPFGAPTYTYLDKQFLPHTMSAVQMRTIALAIEEHVASLYAQLKIGFDGGTPIWPSLTKTVP